MTEADEALVKRSQSGERSAFEELVRRTGRLLFARLYLATGDPHRAEDLAQETFLVAWRSIGQVSDPRGFRPWLFSIAQTVQVDAARREGRKKRSGRRVDDKTLQGIGDQSAGPAQAAENAEQRQRALEALRSLPEEYRLPLMLRYLSGADYDTIARQLALSNGSLRGLLHRGMVMLREKMGSQV